MNYQISTAFLKQNLIDIFRDMSIDLPSSLELTAWKTLLFAHSVENSIFSQLHSDVKNGKEYQASQEILDYLHMNYSKDSEKCLSLINMINHNKYLEISKTLSSYTPLEILYQKDTDSFHLNDIPSFINFYLTHEDSHIDIISNDETLEALNHPMNVPKDHLNMEVYEKIINDKFEKEGSTIFNEETLKFMKEPGNYEYFKSFMTVSLNDYSYPFREGRDIKTYTHKFFTSQSHHIKKHLQSFFSQEDNLHSSKFYKFLLKTLPLDFFEDLQPKDFLNHSYYVNFIQLLIPTNTLAYEYLFVPEILSSQLSKNTLSTDISTLDKYINNNLKPSLHHLKYIVDNVVNDENFVIATKLKAAPIFKLIYPLLPLDFREDNVDLSLAFFTQLRNYANLNLDKPEILQLFNFIPKKHLKKENIFRATLTDLNPAFKNTKLLEHILSYYLNTLLTAPSSKVTNLLFNLTNFRLPLNVKDMEFKDTQIFDIKNQVISSIKNIATLSDYIDEESQLLSPHRIKETTIALYKKHSELINEDSSLIEYYLGIAHNILILLGKSNLTNNTTQNIQLEDLLFIFDKITNPPMHLTSYFKNAFSHELLSLPWSSNEQAICQCLKLTQLKIINITDIITKESFLNVKMSTFFWENFDNSLKPEEPLISTGLSKEQFSSLVERKVNAVPFLMRTTFCQQFEEISLNQLQFWQANIEHITKSTYTKDLIQHIPKKMLNNLSFCLLLIESPDFELKDIVFPHHILSNVDFITKILDIHQEDLPTLLSKIYKDTSFKQLFSNDPEELRLLISEEILNTVIPSKPLKKKPMKF